MRDRIELPRNIIPCEKLYIPIDSAAVMRSGMIIPQEYIDGMPEYMEIDISDKGALYRHELILFDMLANANWERPLYMSMTVGESNYPAVLKKFFVHEGLAYRITPFDWSKLGFDTKSGDHPVDIDRFYDNVMNRFKWGGIKEYKDYYADETVRRMIYTHRNLVSQLAVEMLNSEEPNEKVIALLEKVYKELPSETIPYDALKDNSIALADIYNYIYDKQKDHSDYIREIKSDIENNGANASDSQKVLEMLQENYLGDETLKLLDKRKEEISGAIFKDELEHLTWYNSIDAKNIDDRMLYHRVSLAAHAWKMLNDGAYKTAGRDKLVNTLCDLLNKEITLLEKSRNKSTRDMKMLVSRSIYTELDDIGLTDAEMKKIETSLRKFYRMIQKDK